MRTTDSRTNASVFSKDSEIVSQEHDGSDSIHSFSSSPAVPAASAKKKTRPAGALTVTGDLEHDDELALEVETADEDGLGIGSSEGAAPVPDPPSDGYILVAETSFEEGALLVDPDAEVPCITEWVHALTEYLIQPCGLDALRSQGIDGLGLTLDVQRMRSPQLSETVREQADAIWQEERVYLVAEANRKARREEVLYIDDYG